MLKISVDDVVLARHTSDFSPKSCCQHVESFRASVARRSIPTPF